MPRTIQLKTDVPWKEIRVTDLDWKRADPKEMVHMLHNINLIRAFEETVLELAGETLVHGPAHSSIGQEGAGLGWESPYYPHKSHCASNHTTLRP